MLRGQCERNVEMLRPDHQKCGPWAAALAPPGSSSELQNLASSPDLPNRNLHGVPRPMKV